MIIMIIVKNSNVFILEQKYRNLCALCEFPDKCDYPDIISDYDEALHCLAKGGGDVAFTKVICIKKFVGVRILIYLIWYKFNSI